MNGEISNQAGDLAGDAPEWESVNLYRPSRFKTKTSTEFESITTVEPMEDYPLPDAPLKMFCEEHEKTEASDCSITYGPVIEPPQYEHKKARFVSPTRVLKECSPEIPSPIKAEPEEFIDTEVEEYENVSSTKSVDAAEDLAMQMEQISVSTHSENSDSKSEPPVARLEQISQRIFATILPENETPEQRHCDLMQSRGRLTELTNKAPILVINCGEPSTQLMTTFDTIQNCPFNLNGFPDLATYITFCERVYDWLASDHTRTVMLYAEAREAHTRLLLLCHALSCYFETYDRQDPTTGRNLRQYVRTYPNGIVCTPVGWLRYAGYMRLFSPEKCLSILRSSICIYHLTLYNFPVFEENKSRLFFKFYSGCPLRLVYTTNIHTFSGSSSNGVVLNFHTPADSPARDHGLYLVGDIAVFAYHCRPYPAQRIRLFRLHFHSCQAITNSLAFQLDDFDEISDAFPSSVRLQFYCAKRFTSSSDGLDVRDENLNSQHQNNRGVLRNQINGPLSADDAVRIRDSLENLSPTSTSISAPRPRTVSFRSLVDRMMTRESVKLSNVGKYGQSIGTAGRHLRFASQSDSEMVLPPLCEDSEVDELQSTDRNGRRQSEDSNSLHKRIIKALFKTPRLSHSKKSAQSTDELSATQLMPPPTDTFVVKTTKRKRTVKVGKKLKQLFSGRGEMETGAEAASSPYTSHGARTPSMDSSSETDSVCSMSDRPRSTPPRRPPPPRPPPLSLSPSTLVSSRTSKTTAEVRGTATAKLGPPPKLRKVETVGEADKPLTASVPVFHHTEDLLEAARRLNFMAGTQELDRLLEELRLTSMNMASGLPPIGSQFSSASQYYSPKPHSTSGYPRGSTPPVHQTGYLHQQQQQQQQRHSESRFYTTRSASAIGSHSNLDHGPFSYNGTSFNTQPSGYNYLKQSSYHTERRIDNLNKPTSQYPSYRSLYSPIPSQRHHSIYTTTLKPRTPMGPRQLSQIHLTIDPECGTAEATQGPTSLLVNDQGSSRREQLLESELNSARQELAQLRRAISLVDERRHATRHEELSSRLSPSRLPQSRSPGPIHHQQQQQQPQQQQQQFMSRTTSSYHSQQHGQRSSSTFQRAHPRQDTTATCHQTETETFVSHYSSGLRLDSKKKTHSDVVRRKPLRSCGYQQLGSAQAVTPVQSPSSNRFSHFDYEGLGSMNRKTCRADCVPRSPIHRRQNCHGSSCHYCLSDNTGSLISNCCALDADSGSSTDKEDQYPSIYVANNAKRMTQSYHEQGNTVARDQAPEIVSEEEMMNSKRNTGVSHVIPIIVGSRTPVRKELQIIHEPTSLRQSSYNQDYSSAALCQRIPSTYNQQEQCQRQQEHLRRDQMRSQSHATVTTMCTNTITENAHYIPVTSERKIPIRSKPRQVTIDRIPITFIHEPMIQGHNNKTDSMLHTSGNLESRDIRLHRRSRSRDSSASDPVSRRSTPRSDIFTRMEPLFPQYAELRSSQVLFAREELISSATSEALTPTNGEKRQEGNSKLKLTSQHKQIAGEFRNNSMSSRPDRSNINNGYRKRPETNGVANSISHDFAIPAAAPRTVPNGIKDSLENNISSDVNNAKPTRQVHRPQVTQPLHLHTEPDSMTAVDLSSDHQHRSPLIPEQRLKMDQDYSPQTASVQSPMETAQNVQLMRADRPPVVVSVSYLPRSESRPQGEDGASVESSPISPRLSGRSRYPADGSSYPLTKRAMSHTNVYGPRSWNLRSRQGSESDLAVRRVTSVSSSAGRSSYSAHRERIRQEREQELLMRQQQMQRQRQMAASTTGLHEHSLQHQSRHQQQYRSLSAVNQNGGSEAFEEIETIILQPIGRGVQDIDSRVGSMTTLARAPGGSLIDGSGRQASPSRSTFQHPNASLLSDSAHPQLFAGSRMRTPSPAVVAQEKVDNHPPSTTRTLTRGADPRAYPLRYQRSLPEQIHQHNQPYHSEHRVQQHHQTKSYLDRPMRPDNRTGTPKIPTSTESHSESHFATSFRTPVGSPAVGRRTRALANQPDDISHPSIRRYTPDQSAMDDSEFAILGTDDNKRHLVTSSAMEQAAGFSTPLPPTTGHIPRNQHAKRSKRTEHQPVEELGQLQVEVIEPEPRQHPRSPVARQIHEAVANISPKPALHVDAPFPSGLHRVDDGQRSGLTRRGFSSTQFLHRNTSNSDISRPTTLSQQQVPLSAQTIGASRFGTVSATPQMSGSRSQLSTTSSTIIAPASAAPIPITNGWKNEPTKSTFSDVADGANNLSIVQETAPAWYRPTLSREAAISILRQQPPGSFLIRDSTTFKDAFGLAVKVATLPPKVTPKSDDLQSELVRHYLIEVVNAPNKGVRLKGFASEPVFASLAALIHQHTIDPLALPCRLILPPIPAHIPSSGTAALPAIVIGSSPKSHVLPTNPQTLADLRGPMDHTTVTSGGSVLCGGAPSESGSAQIDGLSANAMNSVTPVTRVDGGTSSPITNDGIPTASSPNVPFVCVLHENPPEMEGQLSQGLTFRCLMLGSVDTPQWSMEMCFSRAVDQLIPLTLLTAADCDRGVSRVRYTEVQLHVSSHDGITIIDLQRRLFLRRHLPNHVLMYCGIETRKKEFSHPEHKLHGIVNPKIFGIVVRKGISECTTHIFTECDPIHTTDSIVRHIRETYPHMNVR